MDDRFAELLVQLDEGLRAGLDSQQLVDQVTHDCDAETRDQLIDAEDCLRLIKRVRRREVGSLGATGPRAALCGPEEIPEHATIGRFELIEELGRGGHGIVFLAWDPAARRKIALKTPHPDVLFTPELRERFLREGIAAARLSHPNIVSVLEVDQSGPVFYIVSAYSEGCSLDMWLAEAAGPVAPRVAAEWLASLADGVEHAHGHGVLHRDLKPSNVLLEPSPSGLGDDGAAPAADSIDSLLPKLTDFGLAKLIDAVDVRTRTGVLVGTPAYMAPEQVDCTLGPIGLATDVYGLGTILYELLTGVPAFAADNPADAFRRIAAGELLAPRERCRKVPRDLEAICLRAMQRRPRDRYPSAAALATDLRRFLAGEMTEARPLSAVGRALKSARRRPATAAALVVATLAAVLVTAGAAWHSVQLRRALETAEVAQARAEQGERHLRELVYLADMREAHQALGRHEVRKASELVRRHQPETTGSKPGFLWRHLADRCFGHPRRVAAHRGHIHTVDFSPDGLTLATAGADGLVRIWDAASGQPRGTLSSGAREVNCARFAPDGRSIAAAESQAGVRLWDVATSSSTAFWRPSELSVVTCLAWSPDGRRLAVAGTPGAVAVVWDQSTGDRKVWQLEHTEEVNALAWSPDGLLLASASSDATVALLDVERSSIQRRLHVDETHVRSVCFSADSRWLATSGTHSLVSVWELSDGRLAGTCDTGAQRVDHVVFSPDGTTLACGDNFGVIRTWDWQANRLTRAIESRQGRIMSLAFSARGDRLASVSSSGSLAIWNGGQATSGDNNVLVDCDSLAAFSSDSRRLFVRHQYRGLATFDVAADTIRDSGTFADGFEGVRGIVPLADQRVLMLHVTSRHQSVINEWDLAGRSAPRRIAEIPAECHHCLVTPDGKLVLTSQERPDNRVAVWEIDTGRLLGELEPPGGKTYPLVATPAGDLVVGACIDGNIYVWELRTRKLVRTLRAHDPGVRDLDLASDGRTLASASSDHEVRLWDVRTGASLPIKLIHPVAVCSVAFCPDEPLVATGDASGKVRIWSLTTGEELLALAQFDGAVTRIRFSPDGRWLAAESNEKSGWIHLWQAPN